MSVKSLLQADSARIEVGQPKVGTWVKKGAAARAAILDDTLSNHIALFDLAVDPPALWEVQRRRIVATVDRTSRDGNAGSSNACQAAVIEVRPVTWGV